MRETDNMAHTASGGKGLGKWFGFGKKKKFKQQGSTGSDESDDDGYQDPTMFHATEPPSQGRGPMPDYPPPRPNASPSPVLTPRGQNRPFSSIELGSGQKGSPNTQSGRHASVLNTKSDHSRTIESRTPSKRENLDDSKDDYFEPWDSRTYKAKEKPPLRPKPVKAQLSQEIPDMRNGRDNYIEPWDATGSSNVKIPGAKDDYIDPWDSTNPSSLPKSSYEEDEDYTVPYDDTTGKVVGYDVLPSRQRSRPDGQASAETEETVYDTPYEEQAKPTNYNGQERKGGTLQSPQEDSATYDEPWEWKQKMVKGKVAPNRAPPPPPPSAGTHAKRREKQPSFDSVPMGNDNYETPWDSKDKAAKDMIAKRFSAAEAEVESGRGDSGVNPVPKPTRGSRQSSTAEEFREYEVDPTIPLENQGWYHGLISRVEAEGQLRGMPDCSYLIRNSESSKIDYSLSLKNNNSPMHLKISCKDGKFILGQHSRPYDSIPEMIHHYSMNNLNIRGAERVKLIYPVVHESMYFTVEPGS